MQVCGTHTHVQEMREREGPVSEWVGALSEQVKVRWKIILVMDKRQLTAASLSSSINKQQLLPHTSLGSQKHFHVGPMLV